MRRIQRKAQFSTIGRQFEVRQSMQRRDAALCNPTDLRGASPLLGVEATIGI